MVWKNPIVLMLPVIKCHIVSILSEFLNELPCIITITKRLMDVSHSVHICQNNRTTLTCSVQ